MKRWDVLGFGAVAVDDLIYLERFPQPDEKMQILDRARDGGGLAGTALVAAARLGARSAWAGVLGFDDLSMWTLHAFDRAGVDTSSIIRFGQARPIHSMILVDREGGTRTILYTYEGVQQLTPDEVPLDLIASANVVLVDHTLGELALHVLALSQNAGVPVVADLERLQPASRAVAEQVEHLIVGRQFAREFTGELAPEQAVRSLRAARGDHHVVTAVTAGDQGCWYMTRESEEVRHRTALYVDVIDTTGCGDVFHGAYAASLARGEALDRAIHVATIAASLKARQPGGRRGIPDWSAVTGHLEHE
jgi:sulfofructose kinase